MPNRKRQPTGWSDDGLINAEERVARRYPRQDGLDELVQGFMASFRDQVVQTGVESDSHEDSEADPLRDLVLYARIHDAVHRGVERLTRSSQLELNHQQISEYLDSYEQRRTEANGS